MNDYYRNKHVLGELTFGDLINMVPMEGDFSIGEHWLPITRFRVSKKGDKGGLFMDSIHDDADVEISLDTKVKVVGNMVSIDLPIPVRIRLDREPEF